jgi:methionyl aminopeptidase
MPFISANEKPASTLIKTPDEIEKMRVAGRLTAKVLEAVGEIIKPGITTAAIDEFCERYIVDTLHARPGSKGQYGYLFSVNTSVNRVICHGAPSPTEVLEKGVIVNVDVTVIQDGYYGDSSKTFCVGPVAPHAQLLVKVTQECLYQGIKQVKPGATLNDIGKAIETHAKKHHYSVVREYCGHGIGKEMHEAPHVMHYFSKDKAMQLQLVPGMTFTIEPMINQGKAEIKIVNRVIERDGKTANWDIVYTADRRLSAQWEHTILVTNTGFEILTLREEEKGILETLKS